MCMKFHSESVKIGANQGSVKCITYGACEHETGLRLHFWEKQIQFAPDLHHDLKDKNFAAHHEKPGIRDASPDNQGSTVI